MTNSTYVDKKWISHRGNVNGPNKKLENSPEYLLKAIDLGFEVECDLWYIDYKYFLGHDGPEYEIEENFLLNSKFWIHCKSVETLARLIEIDFPHNFFYHELDQSTLTSKKVMWVYPGIKVNSDSAISVLPERVKTDFDWRTCGGVCSDFVIDFKNKYDKEHEELLKEVEKREMETFILSPW